MSTLMLLYIRHEGMETLPVDLVAADYFGLSTAEFLKRAPRLGLAPIASEENRGDLSVSLLSLSEYIELRRCAAAKDMIKFRSETISGATDPGILMTLHETFE